MVRQVLSKEKIVATSIALIEKGDAVTFSSVSKQLGRRSQALYTYFENATELQYAIVAWTLQKASEYLQNQVFGQSGETALINFATEWRALALRHMALSRFVLLSPRRDDYPETAAAVDRLWGLLHQLVAGVFKNDTVRLLATRCLRDLIIGDVFHVGMGWFTDKAMLADDSFDQLLRQNLTIFKTMDK
jgi:AcrR family transcriptional regulator